MSKVLESPRFDPFEDRLARDIRNALSSALVRPLEVKAPDSFRDTGESCLKQPVTPTHRDYIDARLKKYELAYARIRRKRIEDPFAQVVVLWNGGLLSEVHERLEVFWRDLPDGSRKAVNGLLQACAAYIHKEYGHDRAARSLAGKAAGLSREYGQLLPAFMNIDELMERLERSDSSRLISADLQWLPMVENKSLHVGSFGTIFLDSKVMNSRAGSSSFRICSAITDFTGEPIVRIEF